MKKIQNIYDNKEFFDSYKQMRDSKINANELIEIPTIKNMFPDLKNKKILDLGCGDCSMARYFVEQGAKEVVAIDVSKNMIEQAKKNDCTNLTLKVMPMEDLSVLRGKFDIVYSSLAFHYVKDFEKLMQDVSDKLKIGGYLIFSQEHPISTCIIPPKNDLKHMEIDGKRYYLVSDYNNVGERNLDWNVKNVVKYHRNFETIVNNIVNAKMSIVEIQESKASKNAIKLVPKYVYQKDRPYFLFVKARKTR